jgi:hypothetical protein
MRRDLVNIEIPIKDFRFLPSLSSIFPLYYLYATTEITSIIAIRSQMLINEILIDRNPEVC